MSGLADNTAAFAAVEAIHNGDWDRHLPVLFATVSTRAALFNPGKTPAKTPEMVASGHQVWVWIKHPELATGGMWEVRGTGAFAP